MKTPFKMGAFLLGLSAATIGAAESTSGGGPRSKITPSTDVAIVAYEEVYSANEQVLAEKLEAAGLSPEQIEATIIALQKSDLLQ